MTATPPPAKPVRLPQTVLAMDFHQHLLASSMFSPVGLCFGRSFPRFAIKRLKDQETQRKAAQS